MEIFISPTGEGAILNDRYSQKDISEEYKLALNEIKKVKAGKQKWAVVDVPREKVYILREKLTDDGYEVIVQGILDERLVNEITRKKGRGARLN